LAAGNYLQIDAEPESEPNAGVTVSHTNNSSKRVWDKRHFCFYCECSFVRLPRHLYSAHSSEPAVATEDKQKKAALIAKVRDLENQLHNNQVLTTGFRSLALVYRPSKLRKVSGSEYLPCQYFLGYFRRRQLRRHVALLLYQMHENQRHRIRFLK